jgi:MFS family permease
VGDGLTFSASAIALAMSVPEERQAGAQGVMGAAQALVAGITAIIIGSLYQGAGRAVAYGVGALGMLILIIVGMALAAEFWRKKQHRMVGTADIGG